MEFGFKTTLSNDEIYKYLDKEGIVYRGEWDVDFHTLFRLELVDSEFIGSKTMDSMKYFWIGMDASDIDVLIDYEVYVEDGWIYLDVKAYETHVEGFFEGEYFGILEVDDVIQGLLEEWEENLGKYIDYRETID